MRFSIRPLDHQRKQLDLKTTQILTKRELKSYLDLLQRVREVEGSDSGHSSQDEGQRVVPSGQVLGRDWY